MRALLAAIRCEKGNVEGNLGAHIAILGKAAAQGCDLALFPEMSLTGSADPGTSPQHLIGLNHPAVGELAGAASKGTAACFGIAECSADGLPHITQVLAAAGRVLGVQRKRHLGEGEESFAAATQDSVCFQPRPACTDAAPARARGVAGSPGGRRAPWAMLAGTRAGSACGSRWRGRPARLPTRTFQAWRLWCAPTAASPPGCRTGARTCSP